MPLFDHRCRNCNARFEALVRGTALPPCPDCGSIDAERLSAVAAIQSQATRSVVQRSVQQRDRAQARERVNDQRNYEIRHDREG